MFLIFLHKQWGHSPWGPIQDFFTLFAPYKLYKLFQCGRKIYEKVCGSKRVIEVVELLRLFFWFTLKHFQLACLCWLKILPHFCKAQHICLDHCYEFFLFCFTSVALLEGFQWRLLTLDFQNIFFSLCLAPIRRYLHNQPFWFLKCFVLSFDFRFSRGKPDNLQM